MRGMSFGIPLIVMAPENAQIRTSCQSAHGSDLLFVVETEGFEPLTLRMRTVRSPKRESYMSPKVGQKNSKNRNKQSKISGTVCIFVI